ncbi:hypothetical protein X793_03875 [Dehalococcoides mccartyi CG4]|uniref:hypothetical protein n=1 Tax=Dehalococcoides mccartyi TaxID=61435 RepID=UPI0004E03FD9|nr:hypothetical protein [Dehalococcoides mccartyi]AII59482.1 hypothetical protein X793_03875 [Dehalococcoides mccartyi CG4]
MLRFDEYIHRRMKEDHLNEFDISTRVQNMKICVDYVFEYFNNYLNITEAEDRTILLNEKIDKYRKQLQEYDPEVQDWLTRVYVDYDAYLNRAIAKLLKENEFFLLFNTEQEFRSLSYDCYSKLIKKHPFLKDQTEMLFLFIKNHHRKLSQERLYPEVPVISEGIDDWIESTWLRYQVNIPKFAYNWVNYFYDHKDLWPATHRKRSQDERIKYQYDFRQKSNLFNLNSLYAKMPKKPYTRGRKQEFEILMMYYWLHSIDGNDDYWQEYLTSIIPAINEK